MKAYKTDYVRPASIPEVLQILSDSEDAEILAGGQSLVAALNLRLSNPSVLVDINAIEGLNQIEDRDGHILLGALVRHRQVIESDLVATALPLVAKAMQYVAHPAIRNQGTTCGSLAYADPAAEMPACAVVLDATLVLRSVSGQRELSARDFYLGLYETLRRDDEMIVEVRFPIARNDEIFGFDELARRKGDFAIVGVAARAQSASSVIENLDLVVFGSEAYPQICTQARSFARGKRWSSELIKEIAQTVSTEIDPMENTQGSATIKRHQAFTLVSRVLASMMEAANVDK